MAETQDGLHLEAEPWAGPMGSAGGRTSIRSNR